MLEAHILPASKDQRIVGVVVRSAITTAIENQGAIEQLIAPLDMANTVPMDARAYKFDIVLRGRRSSPFENKPEGN